MSPSKYFTGTALGARGAIENGDSMSDLTGAAVDQFRDDPAADFTETAGN